MFVGSSRDTLLDRVSRRTSLSPAVVQFGKYLKVTVVLHLQCTLKAHYRIIHPDYVQSVFPFAYGNQARLGQRQRKERLHRIRKRYEK